MTWQLSLPRMRDSGTLTAGDHSMRLLTRYDFDGLGCALLLKEMGLVDEIKLVHPKDIQDGIIEVSKNDVLTNIPYAAGCGLM